MALGRAVCTGEYDQLLRCTLNIRNRSKAEIPPGTSHVSFRQLLRTYQRTRVQQLCPKPDSRCSKRCAWVTLTYSMTSSVRARCRPDYLLCSGPHAIHVARRPKNIKTQILALDPP